MRVLFRERALADLEEISRYLSQRSPTGARNVIQAIHAAIADVAEYQEVRAQPPTRLCASKS
jgi:plasmid stabilization system protein ParE